MFDFEKGVRRHARRAAENPVRIAVVGVGPRGLSFFERICANSAQSGSSDGIGIEVYLVDSTEVGTGSVWRTGQSRHLLMNTVAAQVTIFTDGSVAMAGPVVPGPSLFEWTSFLLKIGNFADLPDEMYDEACRTDANTYPTRALYGYYLRWAYEHIRDRYAPWVRVHEHTATATRLRDDPEGLQELTLSTGECIGGLDAVVLAQGHTAQRQSVDPGWPAETVHRLGLEHIAPVNAADVDLDHIPAGETVIVRGLGLTFFDYMALLTVGRGGRFEQRDRDGALEYVASGREPRLVAGCRRGVPHHARGENQKGIDERHLPVLLDPARIAELCRRAERFGDISFRRDVWPLVAREVEAVYYSLMIDDRVSPRELRSFRSRYLAAPTEGAAAAILTEHGIGARQRWDWAVLGDPTAGRRFGAVEQFHDWLLDYLDADVINARMGNVRGPVKATLDVLRDLRNEVRLIVDHGGITGESYRDDLDGWYTPLNAFLSIGPPAGRIAELSALIRAGVIRIVGPGMRVRLDADAGRFVAESPMVDGSTITGTVLVDARLPEPDLRATGDELLRNLLQSNEIRGFSLTNPDGSHYRTGGLEVARYSHAVLDAYGRPHPRRYAVGVPTEAVHWVTAAGPRPGVNSVTLSDSDSVARSILAANGNVDGRSQGKDYADGRG
ncbi:FAD/NAD(P)-binding protein [Antrihabitans cavernicola]|uniref:FAD/NAD(P)-binding protein n=1 Tax=Antrihabitans cavernicola TaxID=2495913 RepID=A0A5A7S483_9NOCA|nr:FAD/NAD(P)-binding protein [Spelaeibacter cavernicola]